MGSRAAEQFGSGGSWLWNRTYGHISHARAKRQMGGVMSPVVPACTYLSAPWFPIRTLFDSISASAAISQERRKCQKWVPDHVRHVRLYLPELSQFCCHH